MLENIKETAHINRNRFRNEREGVSRRGRKKSAECSTSFFGVLACPKERGARSRESGREAPAQHDYTHTHIQASIQKIANPIHTYRRQNPHNQPGEATHTPHVQPGDVMGYISKKRKRRIKKDGSS